MTANLKSPRLAVTGVTGRLGAQVAEQLSAQNTSVRLLARSPERAQQLDGAEVVESTYFLNEQTVTSLEGIAVLFMVSGKETADRVEQHRQFIGAAAQAGVQHLVYTSYFGAAEDAVFTLAREHWATEVMIRESGMRFTFLRNNSYQDNYPHFATNGVIAGPAEDGKVSAVA